LFRGMYTLFILSVGHADGIFFGGVVGVDVHLNMCSSIRRSKPGGCLSSNETGGSENVLVEDTDHIRTHRSSKKAIYAH